MMQLALTSEHSEISLCVQSHKKMAHNLNA